MEYNQIRRNFTSMQEILYGSGILDKGYNKSISYLFSVIALIDDTIPLFGSVRNKLPFQDIIKDRMGIGVLEIIREAMGTDEIGGEVEFYRLMDNLDMFKTILVGTLLELIRPTIMGMDKDTIKRLHLVYIKKLLTEGHYSGIMDIHPDLVDCSLAIATSLDCVAKEISEVHYNDGLHDCLLELLEDNLDHNHHSYMSFDPYRVNLNENGIGISMEEIRFNHFRRPVHIHPRAEFGM